MPEKFECGDFLQWLRDIDYCASANGWNYEKKLTMLPAFLWGQASSYFHTLKVDERNTYEHLTSAVRKFLWLKVAREQHYYEFEQRALRPNEDPFLFLWGLRQLLDRADPDLTEDGKTALLSRQFMNGLPSTLCLPLLESDPTPTSVKMTEFVHQFRATRCDETHDIAAGCSSSEEHESPHASLLHYVNQLTAAIAALTANQAQLKADVEEPHKHQRPCNPNLNLALTATELDILLKTALGKFINQFPVAGDMIHLIVRATFMLDSRLTRQTCQ